MKLKSGYARNRGEESEYRPLTLDEVKSLKYGDRVDFIDTSGKVRTLKVNGKVRRWKRDTDKVEVPCKYGLYEYYTFTNRDINRLVKEV